jgi:hypothetical protein
MLGTLVSAAVVCAFALLFGQAVLRLCGCARWSWLAPGVGMSVLMIGATPALHLPGRSVTVAVVLALAALACAAIATRDAAMRPPPLELVLAGAPAFLLALVPFAAAGTAGTLGVSLNNDMASHLIWAEDYGSEAIARVNVLNAGYPLGPHAVVAAIHQTLGIATEEVFAGLTLAAPVLLAWTALSTLPSFGRLARAFVATLAGMTFLIAGYYGQGSFKELLQAMLVLAFVGALMRRDALAPRFRWIPPALLVAGILSVYSVVGLLWPAAILGVWAAGLGVEGLVRRRPLRDVGNLVRAELAPMAIGLVALAVVLIPQGPRLAKFFSGTVSNTNATGIATTDLGNLAGRLPVWEAFGAWDNPDYRTPPFDPFTVGMWTAFVLALVLLGVVWWVRKGDWLLPAAAAVSFLIWVVSDRTQSPYVAAKALVILAPMLMLLAARPLVERPPWVPSWSLPWRLAAGGLAVVLGLQILGSSWDALRASPVGPQAHLRELRELRPLLEGRKTLFLGNDDYITWELAGVPVNAPVIGLQNMTTRPEKPWAYGQPFDLDSLDESVLNQYDWIITPHDAAGSDPPDQLRLERSTRSFQLWRRRGPIESRALLPEGPEPAARLDCSKPRGRRLVRAGGVAAVRSPTEFFPVEPVPADGAREVRADLTEGVWDLQAPYTSQYEVEVTAPGLRTTLPAHLDRPGTRWPIGRITVSTQDPVVITFKPKDGPLTPPGASAAISAVLATPASPTRVVPLREACGKLVDWYRSR